MAYGSTPKSFAAGSTYRNLQQPASPASLHLPNPRSLLFRFFVQLSRPATSTMAPLLISTLTHNLQPPFLHNDMFPSRTHSFILSSLSLSGNGLGRAVARFLGMRPGLTWCRSKIILDFGLGRESEGNIGGFITGNTELVLVPWGGESILWLWGRRR